MNLRQPSQVRGLPWIEANIRSSVVMQGTYHISIGLPCGYDANIAGNVRLEDVSLSEGKTVDIRYDGNGDKSKCE
jgi:hypothetical protein